MGAWHREHLFAAVRPLLVWLAGTACLAAAARWLAPEALRPLPPSPVFEHLLAQACAVALLGCLCWWWCVLTSVAAPVTLAAARHGREVRRLVTPVRDTAVRRLVATACGAAVGGLVAAPSGAMTPPVTPSTSTLIHTGESGDVGSLSGLPLPERATTEAGPALRRSIHVVRPGDTLWDVASDQLPSDATDAEIDDAWRLLYRANRAEVGPDPDLIHPGDRLRIRTPIDKGENR